MTAVTGLTGSTGLTALTGLTGLTEFNTAAIHPEKASRPKGRGVRRQ